MGLLNVILFLTCDAPIPFPGETKPNITKCLSYGNLQVDKDVRISGRVVNAGRTSMDIRVILEKSINNSWEKMTVANFTMVARNSTSTGPAVINRLKPQGPEEENENLEILGIKALTLFWNAKET